MLTFNRYSEKTYEKSGVRPVAKTKENDEKRKRKRTSRFSGVHRSKTPNSPEVFRRAENGWQIANFPKIPLLVKLPVNEGFLAVMVLERNSILWKIKAGEIQSIDSKRYFPTRRWKNRLRTAHARMDGPLLDINGCPSAKKKERKPKDLLLRKSRYSYSALLWS